MAFFLKTGDLFPETIVFRLSVGNVQSIRINPSPDYVIHWPAAGSTVPQGMADSPPSPVEYMESSVGNSRSIQFESIGAPKLKHLPSSKARKRVWSISLDENEEVPLVESGATLCSQPKCCIENKSLG